MKRILIYIILMIALIPFVKGQQANLDLENNIEDGLIPLVWDYESDWDSAQIFRKNADLDNSQFQIIESITPSQSTYTDTALCTQDARYFMMFFNDPDTAISDTILTEENDPPPERLIVDSITVTDENKITIGWQKSNDKTCRGYVIFSEVDESLQPYDTILNPNATNYGFPETLKPKQKTYSFFVIAIDGIVDDDGNYCNSSTPIDSTNLQGTILIKDIKNDICARQTQITFKGYNTNDIKDINQQVEKYYLLRRDVMSGEPMQQIDSSDSVTIFKPSIEPNKKYEYLIRAKLTSDYSGPSTSSSAGKTSATSQIPQPDTAYIESASVEGQDIQLKGFSDTDSHGKGYVLERRSDDNINYTFLDSISPGQRYWDFIDQTANPDAQSYYYKLIAIDSCGNGVKKSNVTRTIHLEVNSQNNDINELSWNHYEGWEEDYDYQVYRYKKTGQPENKIAELDRSESSYQDEDFSSLSSGQWYYKVKAIQSEPNQSGNNASVWSNEAKASQETQLKMPNAFQPSSTTHYTFKPVATNINPEGYSLKIFNRWGALIFKSNDPNRGWTGAYKGEWAPKGTYVYILQYQNQEGEIKQKKGTVTLIR